MTLVLYAISDADAIRRDGIRLVHGAGLVAMVGECDGRPVADEAALRTYERTVEGLMDAGTVLPVRFGTTLADETAAQQLLDDRRGELTTALDRVRGAVEMGIRARWRDGRIAAPDTGTGYLRARIEVRARARALAREIDDHLGELVRDRVCRLHTDPERALVLAHLVVRDDVAEYERRCAEVAEAQADADLVCSGPWPPYSFVSEARS